MNIITGFKQLSRGAKRLILWCIIPLFAIGFMSMVAVFALGSTVGTLINMALTAAWLVSVFSFIVFVDSRKRWPNERAIDRLANVLTFKR